MLQLIAQLPPLWQDAICAALLGDAFGAPHEFKAGHSIPPPEELEMVMPPGYNKTYPGVAYGTWTDDGSQLLALLDALVSLKGRYDATAFGDNMLAWLHEARYQAGGVVFDCGGQTRAALDLVARHVPLPVDESACGNGSLMRVLPVAALPDAFGVSPNDAVRIAMAQSALTHPQQLSRVCCAVYIELAWLAKAGQPGSRALLPQAATMLLARDILTAPERDALAFVLAYGKANLPANSGYVVDSLWSALWAIERARSLSQTVRNAVGLGGDTDTVACIAAGLASLVFGWDDTARAWLRQMAFLE